MPAEIDMHVYMFLSASMRKHKARIYARRPRSTYFWINFMRHKKISTWLGRRYFLYTSICSAYSRIKAYEHRHLAVLSSSQFFDNPPTNLLDLLGLTMNFLVIVYVLVTIFQSFLEAFRTPKIEFRSSFIADSVLARSLFRSLKLRTQERR